MSGETLTPAVQWAQRADFVTVSIILDSVTEEVINLDEKTLSFKGKSKDKMYAVSLEFFEDVVPKDSSQRKAGREYLFKLSKAKTDQEWWPRLLKDKVKRSNIKIDFNRWKDEDDVSEDEGDMPGMNMNMEDMMGSLSDGQQGAFDPGESLASDEEDSDDEDLPELEDESAK